MHTSLYSILCIVIRLGAILLAINIVVNFPPAYFAASNGHFGESAVGSVIGFSGALLALAILLWLFLNLLARLAAGQASHQVFESPISANEFQYIAFAVLGIAFVMSGLIDIIGVGMRAALTASLHDAGVEYLQWDIWARVIAQALKVVLGMILVFGSHGLSGVLHRLRETALQAPRTESEGEVLADRE